MQNAVAVTMTNVLAAPQRALVVFINSVFAIVPTDIVQLPPVLAVLSVIALVTHPSAGGEQTYARVVFIVIVPAILHYPC